MEISEYFPQQLIMSKAGAAKLVFTVRGVLEAKPDFVCASLDIKNAYNEMSKVAVVEVFEGEESLRHMAQFVAVTRASTKALEAGGKEWGKANEGETQGLSDATAAFSTGLQPSLVKLDRECRAGGGLAVAGADDVYAAGPEEVVLPAVRKFKEEVAARCGLTLQYSKSCLFTWQGGLPPATPQGVTLAGEEVGGVFRRGFLCFGCPVGEEAYVTHKLMEVVVRILEDARQTVQVLSRDRQALWSALRASANQRFDYWCQLARPSVVRPVAAYLDAQLWRLLEAAMGLPIPRAGHLLPEHNSVLTVPVLGCEEQPFAEWVVRLPVKLHGAGLHSHEERCHAAYLGALQVAAPYMAKVPALQEVMGGEGAWGEDSDPGTRWATLLASGHQDATFSPHPISELF